MTLRWVGARGGAPLATAPGAVGPADLLRLAAVLPEDQLARTAAWLGFRVAPAQVAAAAEEPAAALPEPGGMEEAPARAARGIPFWQPRTTGSDDEATEDPTLDDAVTEEELARPLRLGRTPACPPLSPWPRLWPILQRLLESDAAGARPDVPRLVRRLARGLVVRRVPRVTRRAWTTGATVWVDRSTRLIPFGEDQDAVVRFLRRHCGTGGVQVRTLDETELEPRDVARVGHLVRSAPAGRPLLVLGDLGAYGSPDQRRMWMALGRQLVAQGSRTAALAPVPRERRAAVWDSVFRVAGWEAELPGRSAAPAGEDAASRAARLARRADRLLGLASLAVLVEPGLLREVRRLLPASEADAGTEADVWAHPAVQGWSPSGLVLRPDRARGIRAGAFGGRDAALAPAVAARVEQWHREHPEPLRHVEAVLWGQWQAGAVADGPALRHALEWLRRLAAGAALSTPGSVTEEALAAFGVQLHSELPAAALSDDEVGDSLLRLYAVAHRREALPLPEGVSPDRMARALGGVVEQRLLEVRQVGATLRIGPAGGGGGSLVGTMTSSGPDVVITRGGRSDKLPLREEEDVTVTLDPWEPLVLHTDRATMHLDVIERPFWASALWRDASGLRATMDAGPWERPADLRWDQGSRGSGRPRARRKVPPWYEGPRIVDRWRGSMEVPPWATATGRDSFGLWADVDVRGVVQRFRWVPPGRFWMGSPDREAGRYGDEGPQREVTLTQGYWMADTPVTQALWEAVMGGNPSRFVSPDRPVEQVSWDDCQAFLGCLDVLLPGLGARLPTEAEWENACRAGTSAATWAGDLAILGLNDAPLLDEIAWYGGNCGVDFELTDGHTISWSEKQYDFVSGGSHPVGRKTANPLGIHDLLGNVWEWCSDHYGPYEECGVVDPVGVSSGSQRVRRGGSWGSPARRVRAAARLALGASEHEYGLGFRLVRGHQSAGDRRGAQSADSADVWHGGREIRTGTRVLGAPPNGNRRDR